MLQMAGHATQCFEKSERTLAFQQGVAIEMQHSTYNPKQNTRVSIMLYLCFWDVFHQSDNVSTFTGNNRIIEVIETFILVICFWDVFPQSDNVSTFTGNNRIIEVIETFILVIPKSCNHQNLNR